MKYVCCHYPLVHFSIATVVVVVVGGGVTVSLVAKAPIDDVDDNAER